MKMYFMCVWNLEKLSHPVPAVTDVVRCLILCCSDQGGVQYNNEYHENIFFDTQQGYDLLRWRCISMCVWNLEKLSHPIPAVTDVAQIREEFNIKMNIIQIFNFGWHFSCFHFHCVLSYQTLQHTEFIIWLISTNANVLAECQIMTRPQWPINMRWRLTDSVCPLPGYLH